MTEVIVVVEVQITVTEALGQRSLDRIETMDCKVLANFGDITAKLDGAMLNAFEDQISEALVWARSDDVAAAADAKNEGSV